MKKLVSILILCGWLFSCSPVSEDTKLGATHAGISKNAESAEAHDYNFGDYWYQGKAEITSYTLQQARYGEVHPGQAVMVFVTEPFSKSKHVKLDYASKAGKDKVDALKLNFTRKFNTGIYPYSMMTSVFSPINEEQHLPSLKTTTTSQEWCGHTFTQLDQTDKGWDVQQFSYFESEGNQQLKLGNAWLEDELWNTVRMNPELLPEGEFDIVPSATFLRLSHEPHRVRKAVGKVTVKDGGYTMYTLTYPYNKRALEIDFVTHFPHEIEQWKETRTVMSGEVLATTGKLNKRILSDYWSKNSLSDAGLRKDLGLE